MNRLRRVGQVWPLLLACLLLWTVPAQRAQAQPVSCVVTGKSAALNFGDLDLPGVGSSDTSGQVLDYSCTNTGGGQTRYATLCLNIVNANPPVMLNGTNALPFQLYQDYARTTVWGASGGASPPYMLKLSMAPKGNAGDNVSGILTVYGRLNLNQTGLPPGLYMTSLNTSSTYATSNGSQPADCTGGGSAGAFPFTVSANVINSCMVSASPLDFGTQDTTATNISGSSSLSVTCPNLTPYNIGLTPLSNGSTTGAGVMAGTGTNGDKVPYQLKSVSASGPIWGNTATGGASGTVGNGVHGVGSGVAQSIPVFATVPSANYTPDSYVDTVTVTLTY